MTKKFPLFIFVCIFSVLSVTCVFPYPVIQKSTNISMSDIEKINNYHESEIIITEPESEETIVVKNLNWFDSVNTLFPTYTRIRVIDVYSGKTYYVYRIGGSNHADVEPIDSENTEIFHSLYNYEYSWVRRPVWVELSDGLWVAGSINGYPHGQTYISGNNMDGHTCIHFLLSKTHGTKKVDEGHQKCVQYAYDNANKIAEILNNNEAE